MGFDDPFNWREGVEAEFHDLCPSRVPHLVCTSFMAVDGSTDVADEDDRDDA
ncbi:hypothetical protein KY285_030854 [Solanum tuberosum]|nr:hypothetical protein KY285_030854 [Solanum tuberosum]